MDITQLNWPEGEVRNMEMRRSYHRGAAICARGDVLTWDLDPRVDTFVPDKCSNCGSAVLIACPRCKVRIPGTLINPSSHWNIPPNAPPGFCDNCAQIFSWASKEQKVFELENRIFQSITNESDRESIHSQLEKLITHDISESEEKRIWEKIKTKAGDVLHNESVKEAIYAIASKIALEVLKF